MLIGLDGIIPLILRKLLLMNESMYGTNKISKKKRKIKFGLYARYSSFTFTDQTKRSGKKHLSYCPAVKPKHI